MSIWVDTHSNLHGVVFFPFQEGFSLHKDTGDSNGATWIPGSARSLRGQGAGTLEEGATAVSLGIWWVSHMVSLQHRKAADLVSLEASPNG